MTLGPIAGDPAEIRRMLDKSPDMMFFVDAIDGRISDCNQRLLDALGASREDVIGKPFDILFHDSSNCDLRTVVGRFLAGHELNGCELALRTASRDRVDVSLNAAPIRDESGALLAGCCSMRDVTRTRIAFDKLQGRLRERNAELNATQERLGLALAGGEIGTWEWVAETDRLTWDEQMHRLFGTDPETFGNDYASFNQCIVPADRERVQKHVEEAIQRRSDFRNEFQIQLPSGEMRYIGARGRAYFDIDGKPVRLAGVNWDTTAQRALEEDLRSSEDKLRLLYEHAPIGLVMRDLDGRFVQANERYREIIGLTVERLWSPDQPLLESERKILDEARSAQTEAAQFGPYESRVEVDGREAWVLFNGLVVSGADGRSRVWITSEDITERKRTESDLVYLTGHDVVTRLANRRLFNDSLEKAIARAERTHLALSVLFVDLDRFKLINDTHGHDAGDEVLKVVARRLQDAVRDGDLVARFGGDEFALIIESMADSERSATVAQRLLDRLSEPIELAATPVVVTPSIGIATYPECGTTVDELAKAADIAMYRAKEEGRNSYRFFSEEMHAQIVGRVQIETELRQALDRNQFELYYQPQVDLASGRVLGAEALLRWQHPELGIVSPAEFIPILESTRLIGVVGEWVLGEACATLARWRRDVGCADLRMSVNLSSLQLTEPGLVQTIAEVLERHGLAGESLEVEITESMLMERMDVCIERLLELKELDVSVSMDDFGTGYSSLQYLKVLPIDALKIDRSFVSCIPEDRGDVAIVNATLGMAAALGLEVVAEGVETQEQARFLLDNGCPTAQGYYFSRPMPDREFESYLRRRQEARGETAPEPAPLAVAGTSDPR